MSAKGWCPGVLRPMAVEDGLLVRIKPPMSRLSAAQVAAVADAARGCGSGLIEITSRANLQIRGVTPATHPALVDRLAQAGLADPDRATEARRQIIVTPLWMPGDLTQRLHDRIVASLMRLPPLPEKLGIAVDTGPVAMLRGASADFRIERAGGGLILRADGCDAGQTVTEDTAPDALIALAEWFATHKGAARRVAGADLSALPPDWRSVPAAPAGHAAPAGRVAALPEGAFAADRLEALVAGAPGLRLMPGRQVLIETATATETTGKTHAPHL